MLKHLLFSALAVVFAVSAQAQYRSVVVNFTDGSTTKVINLSSNVSTKFSEVYVNFVENGKQIFSAEVKDVKNFEFSEIAGIDEVMADGAPLMVQDGRILNFRGLIPGETQIRIASVDGSIVRALTADSDNLTIDASGYAPGIYVVAVNKTSFKIALR